jgi:hypothetical protein
MHRHSRAHRHQTPVRRQHKVKTYITKQLGEIIDGLEVQTIIGYDNAPVYSCRCTDCGARGVTVRHEQFANGTSRCTSSLHGKVRVMPATSSSVEVRSRDDGWSEYYADKLKPQEEPPPVVDPEITAKKARQAAANQRRTAELRRQHHRYYNHCLTHGWPMEKAFSFSQWCSIDDHYRGQILERQSSGYYEGSPQGDK